MTSRHGPRRGRERGAAVVDFVLVVVLLLPIVLGIIQVGLVLHVRSTLAAAASEGARYGATADRTAIDGAAYTRRQIRDAIGGEFASRVSGRLALVDGRPGVEVRVRATVPALGLGGPGVSFSVAGHAVAEQP
ncbi:pilus assembly protein [Nocardioides panacisoli]|uniref:TadE family protein n=1 Tax=Nocardioides panacisoli TaxID=627624 RepID=UPI001C6355D4|nr:TadE family protein [Nocardioides panacisoli]QYJ04244.1 pilus assembly protein [Nocardioides panacisoli]